MKKIILPLLAIAAISAVSYAGDSSMSSDQSKPVKTVSCPPECGFSCSSRNEKELIEAIKQHALKYHNMTLTDDQVKKMIKTEPAPAAKS